MFSVLSSKIYGGLSLALLAALAWVMVSKSAVISHQDKLINDPKTGYVAQLAAARANEATLKLNQSVLVNGVNQCNSKVDAAVKAAEDAAAAGRAALAIVERNSAATRSVIAAVKAIPAGSTPGEQCAAADAILLQGAGK